jgi:putative membrane protein
MDSEATSPHTPDHPDPLDEERPKRGISGWIGVHLRGMAMGIAELIPGVSGGTIAFITGIYVELVQAIRSFDGTLLNLALRGRFREVWERANLGFLAMLLVGMATSVVLFASVLAWLLEHREVWIWAFFFGLIMASVLYVGRFARPWTGKRVAAGAAGVGAGLLLSSIQPLPAPEHWISTFLAAAVAICAWILPGISGSFILLLLGKYQQLVRAVSEFDPVFLVAFAAGCVAGLLAFSRVLTWLIRTRYETTLAFLCGLMAGSLQKLWPWRETVSTYVDSSGETLPLVMRPVSPAAWEAITGLSASVPGALVSGFAAFVLVFALDIVSRRRGADPDATPG